MDLSETGLAFLNVVGERGKDLLVVLRVALGGVGVGEQWG